MDGCIGCKHIRQDTTINQFEREGSRRILRRMEFGSFVLTEHLHTPGLVIPPHIHAASSICVTLAGSGVETYEGSKAEVTAGTVIIRPAGELHSNTYGPSGARTIMLEVKPELAADSLVNQMLSQPSVLQNGLIPTLAMRIYQESKANDSAARIVVEGLFLELLGQASRSLHRPHLRPPEWLKSARDLCHEHFNDQLQLSQIATTVGVHPTHLARCFRKHYRMTVGDYIRRLRLDWATQQLTRTDDSIAAIASAAGFYDQSHFTHSFKQQVGVSPADYRASNRLRIGEL